MPSKNSQQHSGSENYGPFLPPILSSETKEYVLPAGGTLKDIHTMLDTLFPKGLEDLRSTSMKITSTGNAHLVTFSFQGTSMSTAKDWDMKKPKNYRDSDMTL